MAENHSSVGYLPVIGVLKGQITRHHIPARTSAQCKSPQRSQLVQQAAHEGIMEARNHAAFVLGLPLSLRIRPAWNNEEPDSRIPNLCLSPPDAPVEHFHVG